MNLENMMKLRSFLKREAEFSSNQKNFNMSVWSCGTAACLAGSAVLACRTGAYGVIGWATTANELLGLTKEDHMQFVPEANLPYGHNYLFYDSLVGWPADLGRRYALARSEEERSAVAIELVDRLICNEIKKRKERGEE